VGPHCFGRIGWIQPLQEELNRRTRLRIELAGELRTVTGLESPVRRPPPEVDLVIMVCGW